MTVSMLLFFAFVTIGLTNIIVESTIVEPVRKWCKKHTPEFFGDAIECHQCVGWWSGLLSSVLFFEFAFSFFVIALGCAFVGSFVSSFEKVIRNYLVETTIYTMCRSLQETEEDEH